MDEDLRAPEGVGARDLGIEDFLRRDRGDVPDPGVGHGKQRVLAIGLEIALEHVVGARRANMEIRRR
nr:hypothetical protein [Marinicauda algicola]